MQVQNTLNATIKQLYCSLQKYQTARWNQRVKRTQPYNSAVYNCKNFLKKCVFEWEQSSPEGVHLEEGTPKVRRSKLQGSKIHSVLEQSRSHLQK